MPVELAELAAGLPVAASFAMAGGISALREGRRRSALNEVVHELRRPLQVIALAVPGASDGATAVESSLRMAAAAVDRLECEINGRPADGATAPVPLRELVEAGVRRWQPRAAIDGRLVSLEWAAGEPSLSADAVGLEQAVDNLISNALVHGDGEVAVEVRVLGGAVRILVRNRSRDLSTGSRLRVRNVREMVSGRRRHGHGLRIAGRVAARGGGSFRLRRSGETIEALLDLPLGRVAR